MKVFWVSFNTPFLSRELFPELASLQGWLNSITVPSSSAVLLGPFALFTASEKGKCAFASRRFPCVFCSADGSFFSRVAAKTDHSSAELCPPFCPPLPALVAGGKEKTCQCFPSVLDPPWAETSLF